MKGNLMRTSISQKIEAGLSILARIIAREEMKDRLAKADLSTSFPSKGSIQDKHEFSHAREGKDED